MGGRSSRADAAAAAAAASERVILLLDSGVSIGGFLGERRARVAVEAAARGKRDGVREGER